MRRSLRALPCGCACAVFGLLLANAVFAAPEKGLPTFAAAEAIIFPGKDSTHGWGAHRSGRTSNVYVTSQTRNWRNGNNYNSTWTFSSSVNAGMVVAVPIGDFKVESSFAYRASKGGRSCCCTGAVVSVGIELSTGANAPREQVMHSAVVNLVNSGAALPPKNGSKGVHIRPLKKSVCARFAAKRAYEHYDARQGKVFFLLEDCQFDKVDPTFVPATPNGATRREREALVTLHREPDRGGSKTYSFVTDVVPVRPSDYDDDP